MSLCVVRGGLAQWGVCSAYHAGAPLARLAVHGRHVARVRAHVLEDVLAGIGERVDGGRVVVVERDAVHLLELVVGVLALRAQVVDLVVPCTISSGTPRHCQSRWIHAQ